VVKPYKAKRWMSAGLWSDSDGDPCLVIWAEFQDGHKDMFLLYANEMRASEKAIEEADEWCCLEAA